MPRVQPGYNDLQTYCIENNLQDLLSQYSINNSIKANEIARRSHTKVKWICPKCGKEYIASPDHRTDTKHPTSCPYCNIKSSSMPELVIYNYFKQVYTRTQHRNRDLNFELDIVIPELKIAIEYDGILYHGLNLEYSDKAKELQKYNFTLIRIIGITYDIQEQYTIENNEHIILLNQDNTKHAESCIKHIIVILNKIRDAKLTFDMNKLVVAVGRSVQIRASGESSNKLSDKVPNIKKYYEPSLNGGIQLNTISAGSHMFLNLKCPDCNNEFNIHISNILRMSQHGACICPKCRLTTPDKNNKRFRKSLQDIFPNIKEFWSINNEYEPDRLRSEVRDIDIKLICPYCKEEISRIPQQMCNNNYRRGSKLKCNYCGKIIPLEVTQDKTKRHNMKQED